MNFSITRKGKKLRRWLYSWNKKTKTLSTNESGLLLDFSNMDGVTFKTGSHCTFITGYRCIFKTGSFCIFDTGFGCTFDTGPDCVFKTGNGCTFKTDFGCIFKTIKNCVIIRRDTHEIIEIPENVKIKLNDYKIKGYVILEPEREIIEISGQKYYKDEVEKRLRELKPIAER